MFLEGKRTPLTPGDAAKALSEGYKQVTGRKPNKKVLGLMLGQSALETGNWQSIHEYNYGGVKGNPAKDTFVQYLPTHEIINGERVLLQPPDPRTIFRAHQNAADGAADYVRTLKSRPAWWSGLHTGSVSGYVAGLTTKPFVYMTADPNQYASILDTRMAQFSDLAKKYAAKPGLTYGLVGLAIAAGGGLAWRKWKHG